MFAGGYVADTVGGGRGTAVATGAVLILVVAIMNAYGVRVSGRVQLGLSAVLVGLLLITTIAALPHAQLANLSPFAPHGWSAVGPAAAVLVWGFAGWEAVTSLSSDYRNPRRDITRATLVAVSVVGTLYLGVVVASLTVLGAGTGSSQAPLADLLAIGLGGPARWVTTVIALLLTVGAMNAYLAGAAKLGAALGRDGALPSWFGQGSESGTVPRRSLAVVTVLSFGSLAVTGAGNVDLESSVLLVTGSFTLVYVLGTAAAVRLLPRGTWAHAGAVGSLICVSGLLVLTGRHLIWGLGVAAIGLAYSVVTARRSSPPNLVRPACTLSERVAP